jgi:hypothetical protein
MKTCFKCNKEKPLSQFYKHPKMADGRLGKCKTCTKTDVSENYNYNREHYAEYERQRFKRPERKKKALEYQRKSRAEKPGVARARNAVSNAVRDGRLIKQPCEKCGSKAQAHHDDYRRPLVVRWLCRKHHLEHHGKVAY